MAFLRDLFWSKKRGADRHPKDLDELRATDEQAARLAAIVVSTEDAIIGKDLDGIVTAWNHGAERLYGYTSHEAIGKSIAMLFPPENADELPRLLEQLKHKKSIEQYETMRVRKDKKRISVAKTISPMFNSKGDVIGAAVISRDITERKRAEERFRLVVEAAPNAMVMVDKDGQIALVNQQVENLFGYTREELIGHKIEVLIPERFRAKHPGYREQFFHEPKTRAMGAGRDLFGRKKDGRDVPIEIGLNPIETPEGLFTLASIIDITERKRAEERFRLVVEAAPNAMVMVDKDGQIALVNQQVENLFGYTREELIGHKIEVLIPERFRAKHPGYREQFFHEPKARAMGAGRDLFGRKKDGRDVPIEIGLNPIETPEGLFTLASIIDITERKRAEERFRLVVEAAPNAMVMVDKDGQIALVNQQVENLFGYTREELIGHKIEVLIPERFRAKHPGYREQFFHEPKARAMGAGRDLFGRKKDGRDVPIEIGLNPIETPEGLFTLASIIDITERRQIQRRLENLNEELEMKVRERTALAEARSQKLRELASALTVAEQQERRRLAQILHDHLQQMLVAAKLGVGHLNQAHEWLSLSDRVQEVQDLLDEAIEASRSLTVELSPPILRDAGIDSAIRWLARWMKEKHGLNIAVQALPEIRNPSEDIKIFLFQAIRELLFNTVKHAGTNEAKVAIGPSGNNIYIEVEDSGKGFDIAELDTAAESSTFGLRNIRERLEMLNCEMSIDSAVGKGTRIRIVAPITEAAAREPQVSDLGMARGIAIPSVGNRKIRVLVVDDHRILRQGIINLFQNRPDIEVAGEAADGEEAITRTRELRPDVVIMDISLPKLNGIDATRSIKTQFPSVRVIGLSLHESEDMQKTMFEAGAEAYLSKTGPIDNLIQTVHNVCLAGHADAKAGMD